MLMFSGCTIYTEKQSESVSRNVYATNESIAKQRIDLAQFYSNQTTKFIKPPKKPIKIESIYLKDNTRVVMVPEEYKNNKVIVIKSAEYQELLKDSDIKQQLERDANQKDIQLKFDDIELQKQKEMSDKMVKDLNSMQTKLVAKDLVILRLWAALIGTWAVFAGAVYLRIKGIL